MTSNQLEHPEAGDSSAPPLDALSIETEETKEDVSSKPSQDDTQIDTTKSVEAPGNNLGDDDNEPTKNLENSDPVDSPEPDVSLAFSEFTETRLNENEVTEKSQESQELTEEEVAVEDTNNSDDIDQIQKDLPATSKQDISAENTENIATVESTNCTTEIKKSEMEKSDVEESPESPVDVDGVCDAVGDENTVDVETNEESANNSDDSANNEVAQKDDTQEEEKKTEANVDMLNDIETEESDPKDLPSSNCTEELAANSLTEDNTAAMDPLETDSCGSNGHSDENNMDDPIPPKDCHTGKASDDSTNLAPVALDTIDNLQTEEEADGAKDISHESDVSLDEPLLSACSGAEDKAVATLADVDEAEGSETESRNETTSLANNGGNNDAAETSNASIIVDMGGIGELRQYANKDSDSLGSASEYDDLKTTKGHNSKPKIPNRPAPVCALWTYFTEDLLQQAMLKFIVRLSRHAALNPYWYIGIIVFISFALTGVGFFTNFVMVFDHEEIFTPMNSLPTINGEWIYNEAGFEDSSDVSILIHADGDSVLHMDAMRRTFEALDILRTTPGYEELCKTSTYLNLKGEPDCWIWSTTQFWKHDFEKFDAEISNDYELVQAISQDTFPDGTPVYKEASYGKYNSTPELFVDSDGENKTIDLLTYVPNFIITVGLPDTDEGNLFQEAALERLKEAKKRWELEDPETNPRNVKLEFFSVYAYLLEYERALMTDMPLVPLVFYVMLLFTCVVFHRLGRSTSKTFSGVQPSRFTLGMLSTFTIGMSLMSGYGLMFCIGIPFTNLAQMVPFIILGVGLDDTFIITGSYFRMLAEESIAAAGEDDTDEEAAIVKRIEEVMEEVGLSIALTTTTTTFAFCLGCASTIPGIRWVCLYAAATIFIDFIYQITLFVAFLTLDEKRMINARRKAKEQGTYLYIGSIYANFRSTLIKDETKSKDDEPLFTQRVMRWYATQLLRPWVKAGVLAVFLGAFGLCLYHTTLLKQAFNVEDYVTADSFTKTFLPALHEYSSLKTPITVYFRNVNQSDPEIQQEMRDFIDGLATLPQIGQPPDFCWVRDLHAFMTGEANDEMSEDQKQQAATFAKAIQGENRTFNEQLDMVLNIPTIRDIYGADIVRGEDGNILTSRCLMFVRHLDLKSIKEQQQLLADQRELTLHYQPTKVLDDEKASKERSFFAFDEMFYYWELYTVAVDELVFTTISGVVAVNVIGFILIPHWTAVLFIFPVIIMLYFLLLGTLQICGIYINAVTYVTIVIAIGLLVDFLMHILLRFYETTGSTRQEKVIETLETMGASMLLGGFTTWLGVIPLSLSSTKIFNTIFVAFIAMVTWGLLISLIFMPVVLSICGPIVCTIGPRPGHNDINSKSNPPALLRHTSSCSLEDEDSYPENNIDDTKDRDIEEELPLSKQEKEDEPTVAVFVRSQVLHPTSFPPLNAE